ncbi:hypothetical protein B0H17DRAFT_1331836 [Mycena rosella]|uniref:F-box domain-containing protein n=1 Tax=Mycena rosella TaxID=1033263 RepID=A0AAD7GDB4_MYCRO|nr:hypothetical protein B0H17DRAFT_1331836 [Mycena rosella]
MDHFSATELHAPSVASGSENWSRLIHLLESNDPPFDSDTLSIRQIISGRQAHLAALDAQLNALRNEMDRLSAERDKTVECIRHHTAVISPIRRLPPELLCEIFAATLPGTRRVGITTVNCPPWRLAHICSPWRAVAVADPFLWDSITISRSPDQSPLSDMYPLSMLETQLLRSGNVSLQVTFDLHNGAGAERQLLDTLLSCCERWASVNLRCWSRGTTDLLLKLLRVVQGRVPRLKKLELSTSRYTGPLGLDFSSAPSLREVVVTDSNFKTLSPPLVIPWHQITRYRGVYTPSRQLDILTAAQNLVECRLGFTTRLNGTQDTITRIITLPALRRLHVSDCDFLTHITAPSLQDLRSYASVSGSMDPVLDFIQRSSCRLTRLTLGHTRSADKLVPLLRCLPSLEYLFLNATALAPQHVASLSEALEVSGRASDLCPNLAALVYGRDTYNEVDAPDDVLDMVCSRLHPRRRLASFRIYSFVPHADFVAGLTRWMAGLVARGLDVAFISNEEAHALMTGD